LSAVSASYFITRSELFFVSALAFSKQITFPVLLIMFIGTFLHGRSLRKRINAIGDIPEFETKVQVYEKVYSSRLQWNLISCLILCLLFVLSGRYFFFYFSIFQVVIVIPLYPNLLLFRRELKNEEIILY
jgi:hypothetical protein